MASGSLPLSRFSVHDGIGNLQRGHVGHRDKGKEFSIISISWWRRCLLGLNAEIGSGHMDEEAPDVGGKLVALSVLLTSLIISVIGLYFVLTNWRQGEGPPISLFLAILVILLILLIISMMRKVASGSRKPSDEEF
jgi:hypothetical protein